MRLRTAGFVLAFFGAAIVTGVLLADPARLTVIAIEDLDCPTCAKKVVKTVSEVPGVAEVKTDVETSCATVTAKAMQRPSPRALWEAVEKAGFKPKRLEGPSGTFTAKPQS